jgi:hypothetical protein
MNGRAASVNLVEIDPKPTMSGRFCCDARAPTCYT